MDQSLLLTGEQKAFIEASPPDELITTHSTNGKEKGDKETENTKRTDELCSPEAEVLRRLTEPSACGRARGHAFVQPVVLSPLTTRLHPNTSNALKRAYLERKLAGIVPNTQQEIVEAALDDWLVAHGYMPPQIADQN